LQSVNEASQEKQGRNISIRRKYERSDERISRVVEYKGCAIDPVFNSGFLGSAMDTRGKEYDRLPAFATRTKASSKPNEEK
jgi:hypothetical protein